MKSLRMSDSQRDRAIFGSPMSLFGIPISEHPLVEPMPALQVRPYFTSKGERLRWLTEKDEAEFNAYLLKTFGVKHVAYFINGRVFMNPRDVVLLKSCIP